MSAKSRNVLQIVSGWEAAELIVQCIFVGLWQLLKIVVQRLWKGHRRKSFTSSSPVELTVDSSIGTHCYVIVKGVKYHYVEIGPKYGQKIIILGDAPNTGKLWSPNWTRVVQRLAETGHHVVTLDLRGSGGSEGGSRAELSPPRAVDELSTLMEALKISENNPAVVIGFGIGGMLTWYLVHSRGELVSKFVVVDAPHPNLYWQYPPASYCARMLHFIQWPYFPERWLAETQNRGVGTRACDWNGALNYIRGAAWCRVRGSSRAQAAALLVSARDGGAEQLVASAQRCAAYELRLLEHADPGDRDLPPLVLDFVLAKDKVYEEEAPRGLMGRVLGAVAGRGRELTARLVAAPAQA